jgi:hypothetical protein
MKAEEIEDYLSQLGQELVNIGIEEPIHILMIGGAYMLLMRTVADRNELEIDWFNYMTHLLMYDQVVVPKGKLWKRFGPLCVNVPSREYILALKIIAGRDKDIEDSKILLQQAKIKTRQQAQQLFDRYIPPLTQQINAERIERSLKSLFEQV